MKKAGVEGMRGHPEPNVRRAAEAATLLQKYFDDVVVNGTHDEASFLRENPQASTTLAVELQSLRLLDSVLAEEKPERRALGDFELVREIGKGATSTVYEAYQASLDRSVALKLLYEPPPTDTRSVERFQQAAKLAAALRHPNLVEIYDLGVRHREHYCAMELVAGRTLQQIIDLVPKHLQEGATLDSSSIPRALLRQLWRQFSPAPGENAGATQRLAVSPASSTGARRATRRKSQKVLPRGRPGATRSAEREAVQSGSIQKDFLRYCRRLACAMAGTAEGLHHAHLHEVVHRDLKPSNLILERGGRLRILDFGLARKENLPHLTATGEFVGTPVYASPEQARADADSVGRASDVYSLGATLYTCLAWQPPFRAHTSQGMLRAIIEEEVVPLRRRNSLVPRDLETIVAKCLEKQPEARYHSAEALAQELHRFARGEDIETAPASRVQRSLRSAWRMRKRALRFASVLVVALAAIFVAFEAKQSRETQKARAIEQAIHASVLDLREEDLTALPPKVEALGSTPVRLVERLVADRYEDMARGGSAGTFEGGPALYEAGPPAVPTRPDRGRRTIEDLSTLAATYPESAEAHYYLARALVRANLIDDAARALAQAQQLSPRCLEYQALSADLARDASPAQSELGEGPAAARAAPEEQWIALRRAVREAERHADWGRAVERHAELARHPLTVKLPENLRFELRLSRALCLLRAGLPNVAAYELGSCQEKTPDSFWPVLLAGQASLLTGEMKSAGERFSEAHSLAEKSRDAEFVAEWVVAAFLAEEREDEALAWSARIADPLRRKLALAEIELGRKEPQKALVEAREAVALAKAGDRVEALLLVGNILVAMADGESTASAADAVYEEARAAAPGDPRPILGLAACALAARNDLEGSKKLYLEALGVSPRSSAAHYGLGTVYRRLNDPAAALAAYESCLREAPDHALAHNNRGLLLEAQHRREEARDEFERAAVLAPRFAVARFNLGMSFHRDGQYVRAAEEYERARKLGLDNSLVLGNLGVCLYYAKRYEEATACFSRAIEADPKDFEAYFNRGVVNEVGRNDLAAARPDYEISVRLRGDWTKSRNGLAAAYALEGRVADAALEYRACFRIDPRFVWAYNDLARLLLRGGLNVPSGDALAAEVRTFEAAEHLSNVSPEALAVLETYRERLRPAFVSCASIDARLAAGTDIVGEDAVWLVEPPGAPSPAEWNQPEFNDAAWLPRSGAFGARERPGTRTVLPDLDGGERASIRLRHTFVIDDMAEVQKAWLRIRVSGGFRAYLNGNLVAQMRFGSSDREPDMNELAVSGTQRPEVAWMLPLPLDRLRAGQNVLAIRAARSSDSDKDDGERSFLVHPMLRVQLSFDSRARELALEELEAFRKQPHAESLEAYFRARIHQLSGETAAAADLFRRASELYPREPEPVERLAECLAASGKRKEAEAALRDALERDLAGTDARWDSWFAMHIDEPAGAVLDELPGGGDVEAGPAGGRREEIRYVLRRLAAQQPLRIDCGASVESRSTDGALWTRDMCFRDGNEFYISAVPDAPSSTNRHFFSPVDRIPAYRIPLPRGSYTLTLHFFEGMQPEYRSGPFDVLVEGQPILRSFDPLSSGSRPTTQRWYGSVDDGALDIDLIRRGDGFPSITGIEVEAAPRAAANGG